MNTKEILSIVAITALGLCLLCGLAKSAMKTGDKGKNHCDKACGAFVFLAIVLLAVSQLLGETEKYDSSPNDGCGPESYCKTWLTPSVCQGSNKPCGSTPTPPPPPPPPPAPTPCTSDTDCPESYCVNPPGKKHPFYCHPT